MRSIAAILLLAASLFGSPPPWTAGSFRGLTAGRARRADALRVLGAPTSPAPTPAGEDLLYKARGSHHGDLTVRLDRSGLITEIQESFPVAIPRTQALQRAWRQRADGSLFPGKMRRQRALSRSPRSRRTHSLSGARNRSLARPDRLRLCRHPSTLRGRPDSPTRLPASLRR